MHDFRIRMVAVALMAAGATASVSVEAAAPRVHWAYQPPVASLGEDAEGGHPVDRLLEAAWDGAGIERVPMAAPRRWVERAAFTLTGLPARPDWLRIIEESPDDATWLAVLDEMLASPAYGERWARHWMDVARYADTQGYNFDRDNRYPHAYTYRDWLVRAFNEDMPYPRFIRLQIAADHLVETGGHPDLAALGFLTVGPRGGGPETIDDRVDVITRGFLASTVSCARCHDHKTDPVTMRDYYSIYSILENTYEPDPLPEIGKPADHAAHADYLADRARHEARGHEARQALVDHMHEPEALATYLDLAWLAIRDGWDYGRAHSEAFARGRFRGAAVIRWRDFLRATATGDQADAALAGWFEEMEIAGEDAAARAAASAALAKRWLAAGDDDPLRRLAQRDDCPLSLGVERIHVIMDVKDNQENALRRSALAQLEAGHPGAPPRAMVLHDRSHASQARVFRRGDPSAPGEPFVREWLGFLGGGEFPEGIAPRLAVADRIAEAANPLTGRVMVNRVWAWHFGEPLADPGDFGPQEPAPRLLPLLDELAVRFAESGGSLKDLHRLLLTSRAFRLAADGPAANNDIDEANHLHWKWNRRRADFEALRDRLLATSGALDPDARGGRPVNLDDPASDRWRTIHAFIDRYELPQTFVSFDLPHPDHHSPRRVATTVPQQALWFLNGPLVLRQAAALANHPELAMLNDTGARLEWIYQRILQRAPTPGEHEFIARWLGAIDPADYQPRLAGFWEIRHAPVLDGIAGDPRPFPLFADGVWKTGPDIATASIRWLHAGRDGGHAAAGHALILRWRAHGAGEARLVGTIRRTQRGGNALEWMIDGPGGALAGPSPLSADSSGIIDGPWVNMRAGDTLALHVTAPHGDHFGSISWDLRIDARDAANESPATISDIRESFPTTETAPSAPAHGDPWADVIQALWASNEFAFID
jgi:hypothetical protein